MPRVIGIDPGTVSIDICGLDDGRIFLDRSLPTSDALSDPESFVRLLEDAHRGAAPLDLIAGPSGYGLPLIAARDLTDTDLRLAYLAAEGETGGIGGLRSLMRTLARSDLPIVLTPGVIHLRSVPDHRKVNRVDMGTADKVCATALALHTESERRSCSPRDVSFILLELGGAFTAAVAVDRGQIVDGVGGSSGPLGMRAVGALDGEVAFLAGTVTKRLLFQGGAASIAANPSASVEMLAAPAIPRERVAADAYVESAAKAVASLLVSVPSAHEIILSGRVAHLTAVRERLEQCLAGVAGRPVLRVLTGSARAARQAAEGAALIADGLAGGQYAPLVDALGIRDASGTAIDHLYVITPADARERLGMRANKAANSNPEDTGERLV